MAAPTPTTRGTPAGIRLDDGYQTLITFALNPTISFWEKTVQPPGMDGGDAINTTTMHNVRYRTFTPKSLITLTDGNCKVAYDPDLYDDILTLLNRETTITIKFSDGSTLAFFGFLRSFEPDEITEGEQPEATVNFTPTNVDPANHVEADPVMTEVAGT